MDTRLDLHVQARRRRAAGRVSTPVVRAAGAAVAAVVLAGVIVLIVDGHGVSWLSGLVAGAGAGACRPVGRGRIGARSAGGGHGAQRRTELAVEPLRQTGWSFVHGVPGPD